MPPLMVKTAANPKGCPRKYLTICRRPCGQPLPILSRRLFGSLLWLQPTRGKSLGADHSELVAAGHDGRREGAYDGIVAFSQTDFTEDLKKISVPVLVMHSEDDQIVPYVAAGPLSAKLLKNGSLKTYKDLPHGMLTTHAETVNADLLAFLKAGAKAAAA